MCPFSIISVDEEKIKKLFAEIDEVFIQNGVYTEYERMLLSTIYYTEKQSYVTINNFEYVKSMGNIQKKGV